VASPLGFVFGVVAELQERILVFGRNQHHVPAAPAIAAARTAPRDILLPAKGQATVAAIAGLHQDSSFVQE
jgi:hypothetical protein